jgi:4-hydroxy-4-methyl-2-oxoglutarate aldolase
MVHPVVVRSIPRCDPETIRVLGELGVATVHEALGRTGLLDPIIRPIYPQALAAGSAITVLSAPGDNLMIHAALAVAEPGDLLVVSTTGPSTDGMFGELLAAACAARGVVGLVIDAGVRDTAELERVQFPVWSRAISAQGTVKATAGAVNVPIACAGAQVHPGDVVVADRDGVMIVPRTKAETAATLGEQRRAKEHELRERLRGGALTLDLLDLRSTLDRLGVRWVDRPTD